MLERVRTHASKRRSWSHEHLIKDRSIKVNARLGRQHAAHRLGLPFLHLLVHDTAGSAHGYNTHGALEDGALDDSDVEGLRLAHQQFRPLHKGLLRGEHQARLHGNTTLGVHGARGAGRQGEAVHSERRGDAGCISRGLGLRFRAAERACRERRCAGRADLMPAATVPTAFFNVSRMPMLSASGVRDTRQVACAVTCQTGTSRVTDRALPLGRQTDHRATQQRRSTS
jgi:hypothetical protein